MASTVASPAVTVLMPVFNGGRFIGEAIQSILGQTFTDFELLIIDDGSTDDSLSVIGEYAARDRRIRVVERENRGLVATLNEGIELAHGTYLARMDCDDISFPARLQQQHDFMRAHPDYILCGSNSVIVNSKNRLVKRWKVPVNTPDTFRLFCCFSTPLAHSSAFINLGLLRAGDFRYRDRYSCAEDFELWGRLCAQYPCTVLDDFLVAWRDHSTGICRSQRGRQMEQITGLVERNIASEWFGISSGVYQNLVRRQHQIVAGDIDEAAGLSNELIARLERLPKEEHAAARLAFYIFLNRLIVEIAYVHSLDNARDFYRRLSLSGKLGLRSWCLMIFPRWFPDSLVFRLESAAEFLYRRVLPARGGGGGGEPRQGL